MASPSSMDALPPDHSLDQLRVDRRFRALQAHLEAATHAFAVEERDELTLADTRYSPPLVQRYHSVRRMLEAAGMLLQEGMEDADSYDRIDGLPATLTDALSPYGLTVRKQRAEPEPA